MQFIDNAVMAGKTNFILIGEAGCGKSEIALNLAKYLSEKSDKKVHLFDMDMTKPLFRSRDILKEEALSDITFHYEEQFYDAPTIVGGVREHLANDEEIVVMDVGGDDIGARSIGGFMMGADKEKLCVMYVLNYYRPFCQDLNHIDRFLSEILTVSRLSLKNVHFVDNPNIGISTSAMETIDGAAMMKSLVGEYKDIEMTCTGEDLLNEVQGKIDTDLMPLHFYLTYEWLRESS